MRVLGLALLLLAVVADSSLAQSRVVTARVVTASADPSTRPIVLVVESPGGARMATEVRAALNHDTGFRVLSLLEAQRQAVRPAALLTVATEHARVVRVVYWDLAGDSDSLTGAAPENADQLSAVMYALVTAMLDKHRGDGRGEFVESDARMPMLDAAHASRAIYAMLGRFSRLTPRTNVELRFEDF